MSTPGRIDKGDVGYLRASFGMRKEIELYYKIFFPDWEGYNGEETNYNFLDPKNQTKLISLCNTYLISETEKKWSTIIINSIVNFFNLGVKKNKEGLTTIIDFS